MKKVGFAFLFIIVGVFVFASAASAQVAVACGKLQTLSDLSDGVHQVDGGTVTVTQNGSQLTIHPTSGGSVCRFEAMNADGSTPIDGTFDGNQYVQTGHIDKIEFAFMPTAGESSVTATNTPVVLGAGAFVGISILGLVLASKQFMKS